MDPKVIGVIVVLIVAIGLYIYYSQEEGGGACATKTLEMDCKSPCVWDKYGSRCVDKDQELTPAPPTPPTGPAPAGESEKLPPKDRPIFCGKGAKPETFTWLYELYDKGTAEDAQPEDAVTNDLQYYERAASPSDGNKIPLAFKELDDNFMNMKTIYKQIYNKTGKKAAYIAISSGWAEYPEAGRLNQISFTHDANWSPLSDNILDMSEPWCNAGRSYFKVGSAKTDMSEVHHTEHDVHLVYDLRNGPDVYKTFKCERPSTGTPGALAYRFSDHDNNYAKAKSFCIEEMGCKESDQCYAVMERANNDDTYGKAPDYFGCHKCTE